MSFPTSLDNFTNPTTLDSLSTPAVLHSTQHTNINNAVEALEAKVGINSSAVTSSLDYKVTQLQNQNTLANVATVGPAGTGAQYTTIQAALNALTTGGIVRVLAQNITVTSGITYTHDSQIIEGVYDNTVIQCDGTTVAKLISPASTGLERCGLRDVKLVNTSVTTAGTALDLSDMALFDLDHVWVVNFNVGLNLNDTTNITFYNSYRNLTLNQVNTGIKITPTNPVNMNLFENIRIAAKANGTSLNYTQGQGNVFINLDCEPASSTGTTGILLGNAGTGVVDTTFIGAWVEGNNLGVSINAAVLRTKFIGCTLGYNTTNITDSSPWTMYLSCRQQDSLKNDQIGLRLPVINGSTLNALEVYLNSSVASNKGINIANDTNFAQTGDFIYVKSFNITDTGSLVHLVNTGTGNFSILSDNSVGDHTFSVNNTGNVRSLGSIVGRQFTLTDAATVALNATLGNSFYLAAGGDRTIGVPTNATEGQIITIDVFASGGARTITLSTGTTGSFRFGSDITALSQTVSGKNDYITCRYNSTDQKWDVTGYVKGY